MASCCCSPFTPSGGGGGSLVNLPNTVWVAQGTTVPGPDQTGNIEAPFATLAAARTALLALGNSNPKTLVVMPGDYSGEASFAWDSTGAAGRLHMVNGSWLPMQLNQSIQDVTTPALAITGINFFTGLVLGTVSGTGSLYLTSCQKLSGTIAAGQLHVTNCYLLAAMTLAQTGSVFRDSTTGNLTQPGDGRVVQFYDCNVAGNITFTGDPGVALQDDVSAFWMDDNAKTFTNGSRELMA